ncbi:MAG: hypothetical protein AAGJ35_03120, partial [Myxococcota bacterium]
PCASVSCTVGYICEDGQCVHDVCTNIRCAQDERCVAGQCLAPKKTDTEDELNLKDNKKTDVSDSKSSKVNDKMKTDKGEDLSSLDDKLAAGCQCQHTSSNSSLWLALFVLLLLRFRKRVLSQLLPHHHS